MPTYDYVCDACGHEWEVFQNMSERHLTKCPSCKEEKARRKIGAGAGLIFKGSGFYVTDYKGGGRKASSDSEAKSDGEAKGDKAASDAASSESKPAAESAAKPAASASETKAAPASSSTKPAS